MQLIGWFGIRKWKSSSIPTGIRNTSMPCSSIRSFTPRFYMELSLARKKKSPWEDMDRAPPSLTPAIELLRTSPAPSLTPKNQALPPSSTLVSKVSKSSSSVSVDLPVVDVDPVVSSSSFSSGVPRLPSRGLAPPRRGLHHRTLPELHPAMASVELHLAPTCHGHHRGAQLLPAMASITLCPSSAQL